MYAAYILQMNGWKLDTYSIEEFLRTGIVVDQSSFPCGLDVQWFNYQKLELGSSYSGFSLQNKTKTV